MSPLRHLFGQVVFSVAICVTIGAGIACVILLIGLPCELAMDRWYIGSRVAALAIGSSAIVGLIAGVASGLFEHGLPLLRSVMIVAVTAIAALVLLIFVGEGFFLMVPIGGVIVGGIVVVLAGIAKTRCARRQQENKDIANKA
jgi:hypothetical protein